MVNAWSEITIPHLMRAWDIPGLEVKIILAQENDYHLSNFNFRNLENIEEEEDIIEIPEWYWHDNDDTNE